MVHPKYLESFYIDTVDDVERIAGDRYLPLLREYWGEDWLEDEMDSLVSDTYLNEFLDYVIERLPEVYIYFYDESDNGYNVWQIEFPYDQNDIIWWKK